MIVIRWIKLNSKFIAIYNNMDGVILICFSYIFYSIPSCNIQPNLVLYCILQKPPQTIHGMAVRLDTPNHTPASSFWRILQHSLSRHGLEASLRSHWENSRISHKSWRVRLLPWDISTVYLPTSMCLGLWDTCCGEVVKNVAGDVPPYLSPLNVVLWSVAVILLKAANASGNWGGVAGVFVGAHIC